jgi:hypothetical protein
MGGRTLLAGELTLDDLADLQAPLDRAWPDPMDGLRDRLGAMGEDERRAALREAHARAEEGPPSWAAPETDAGLRHFLRVALSRHNPGLTGDDIGGVFDRITPGEYAALLRTCRGVTPLDEAEAWLGLDRHGGGEPITWTQAVVEVCEAYPGWTIAQVGALTVSQVRALRAGGRPEVRGVPVRPGMDLKTMVREARRKFHGPDSATGSG